MLFKLTPIIAGLFSVSAAASDVQDTFFKQIGSLCGQAFEGGVVEDNRNDTRFAGKKIILHVRDCSDDEIRMPMHVGDDHSRTFILSKVDSGLKFKHDHRHKDGSPDVLTMYGGITLADGTAGSQDFPADAETKELFTEQNLLVSLDNIWTFSVAPGESIGYALNRPNRQFKIKFDLTKRVANPPKAWGAE